MEEESFEMLNFPDFPPFSFMHFYQEFTLCPQSHVKIG